MNKKIKIILIYVIGVLIITSFIAAGMLWRLSIQKDITLSSSCSNYAQQIENSVSVYVTVYTSFFNIAAINHTESNLCAQNQNPFNTGP